MSSLLEITGPNHEALIKEAIGVLSIPRAISRIAAPVINPLTKAVVNRVKTKPISTALGGLGAVMSAGDVVSRTRRMGSEAASAGERAASMAGKLGPTL